MMILEERESENAFQIFNWKCEIKRGNISRICAFKHVVHWLSYDFDSSMQIYSSLVYSHKIEIL